MLARASGDAERAAALGTLASGVQRAMRLIEQLLALARQEPRPNAARSPVPLDELEGEVAAELVPLADAGQIDLGVSAAPAASVYGDPESLRTLLRNLVDNAVRYTPAGGRVDVAVEAATDARSAARLIVSDTGPGIPPEERSRVLDRFYRRAGTAPAGSGLRLSIVKAIPQPHGATLELADGPAGQGLTVRVSFPPLQPS